MSAQILDGKRAAAALKERLKARVSEFNRPVGLGTLLVGEDPASHLYVAGKHRDCAEIGLTSIREDLPQEASIDDVRAAMKRLNTNPECAGYIVQLPLPKHLPERELLELIDPHKDADGLHPINLGRLVLNTAQNITSPLPCTPAGIVELLRFYGCDLHGANVCVIGRGVTVGRSIGLLLTRKEINATVTQCHTGTRDLAAHTRAADVIISAAGSPYLLTPEMVKPGAIVIDVGVSRIWSEEKEKYVVRGDVHPHVAEVASWISPNPGGVGPMTRAMLLSNVVNLACQNGLI